MELDALHDDALYPRPVPSATLAWSTVQGLFCTHVGFGSMVALAGLSHVIGFGLGNPCAYPASSGRTAPRACPSYRGGDRFDCLPTAITSMPSSSCSVSSLMP
jgi:hypothetical protein